MKAAIYARFSSHNQREESIEGQVRACQRFAKEHGMTVIEIYADRGLSGLHADNRPEFQRMIQDSDQSCAQRKARLAGKRTEMPLERWLRPAWIFDRRTSTLRLRANRRGLRANDF